MTNTLQTPHVSGVLNRLFAEAARDGQSSSGSEVPWRSGTPQERADAAANIYMPISASGGKLLYTLVRASRPQTIIEFGTSFGISTIHLAAAAADNGVGRVVTTELSQSKIAAARNNLKEAHLEDRVTILAGDARETLKDVPGPISLVLLDGWKDLCLPVLHLLESRLATGATVVADDIKFPAMSNYLAYVRDAANGYVTVEFPVEDGMEISCWTGPRT